MVDTVPPDSVPLLRCEEDGLAKLSSEQHHTILRRAAVLMSCILLACSACFVTASIASERYPIILSHTMLAFCLGLRHAVDCDHLAAIDNVTRQFINRGEFPVSTGFWFAVGHSSIVFAMTVIIAGGYSMAMTSDLGESVTQYLSIGAAFLSISLLGGIGILNASIASALFKDWCSLKRQSQAEQSKTLESRGQASLRTALSSLPFIRRIFNSVDKPSKMAGVGFLFGLSFDTATQVGLIGLAAVSGSNMKLPPVTILIFPIAFCCGMCLVDTGNGLLMLMTYGWATVRPIQKLFYNMLVTAMSAIVAILIGSMEFLQLLGQRAGLTGHFWTWINSLDMGTLGYTVIACFTLVLGCGVCTACLTQASEGDS